MAIFERPGVIFFGSNDIFNMTASRVSYTPLDDKTYNKSKENVFIIKYIDNESDKDAYFNFALLPAIDSAANKGGNGVPEVKPGIVTMTNMKYKNFLIPGSTPVIQTIGVQSTMYQFVGAFIGSETISEAPLRPSMNPVYRIDAKEDPPYNDIENAFMKAKLFDRKIVQSGRPIKMTLKSDVSYEYEGVIVNFKFYAIRADRAYYTMDLLATVYPHQKPPVDSKQFLSDGALRGQSPKTDLEPIKDNKKPPDKLTTSAEPSGPTTTPQLKPTSVPDKLTTSAEPTGPTSTPPFNGATMPNTPIITP